MSRRVRLLTSFLAILAASLSIVALPATAAAPVTGEDVVLAGIYSEDWESGADLTALGAASGKRVSIQGSFHDIGQSGQNVDWILEQAWSAQATPFANVTIQASAASIAAGAHDGAIASFAANVKAWTDRGSGRSLFVAPLQEMNGNWTPYGMDPGAFRVAYRKFVDAFHAVGLDETKVRFVFAPNGWSTPPYRLADYYPGDEIVDLIGFSAYNFGTSIDRWTSVGETLNAVVAELRTFAPSKPYLVAQVASSAVGGDRAGWIRDLFAYTADHPNIVGFIWFNLDKETDWRIWDGSTLAAGWRDGMQSATTIATWPLTAWFQTGPLPFSPERGTGAFDDDDASGFEADIEWLVAAGITQGCDASARRYCPTAPVTRSQMAAFLTRALALNSSQSHSFTDISGSSFESEIAAVAAAEITQGCTADGTRFCPTDPVTRGEMAAFLVRALQLPDGPAATFVDVDGSLFEADIAAVAAAGITRGCTADMTRFCPTDPVTRGEMAAFLRRALD